MIKPTKYDIIQDDQINLLKRRINNLNGNNQSVQKYSESLTNQINGINQTFTTLYNFYSSSTRLFLNGQRLIKGIDYIELSSNEIFLNIILSKGRLLIDYLIGSSPTQPIQIYNENLFGLINNSNDIFSTQFEFIYGTTEVYLNGVKLEYMVDYIELNNFQIKTNFLPKKGNLIIDYARS